MVLKRELRNIAQGDDQDVVKGVVAGLLSAGPADLVAERHEEKMRENGLCRIRTLARLTEQHLRDVGVSVGDAMLVLELLHEAAPPPMSPMPGTPMVGAQVGSSVSLAVPQRRPDLRPFPKLGASGYPELGPWRAYRTALRARLQPVLTDEGKAELENLEAGGTLSGAWVRGCEDDKVVFAELVNGPGAIKVQCQTC
jgi:hypothetical protein